MTVQQRLEAPLAAKPEMCSLNKAARRIAGTCRGQRRRLGGRTSGRAGRRGWRGKGDVEFATAAAPGTRRSAFAAPGRQTGLRL